MIVESDRTLSFSPGSTPTRRRDSRPVILWRRSAPAALIEAVANESSVAIAREVRSRHPFRDLEPGGESDRVCPLVLQPLWSRYAFEGSERSRDLSNILLQCNPRTRRTHKQRKKESETFSDLLEKFQAGPPPDPFELLAWLMVLIGRPGLNDELFAQIWLQTWTWSRPYWHVTAWQNEAPLTDDQRLLAAGELLWLCSLVFRDAKGARRVRERGVETLRAELLAGCDTDGSPHAYLLERLPLWLAPFTRAASVAGLLNEEWRDKDARSRYARLVRRVAAITRSTGEVALSNGAAFAQPSLLKTAAACAGLKRHEFPARFLSQLPDHSGTMSPSGGRRGGRSLGLQTKRKHRPSRQSDAARLACLRGNWGVGSDACVIAFDGAAPRIDLTAFSVPLLRGTWRPDTTLAGLSLQSPSDWECVCWFTDADIDYLELKQTAVRDVEVLRQVLLSRNDHFLLLSDVVKGTTGAAADIEHQLELPLVAGTHAERDALTREWRVRSGPLQVRVLPLGLPQDSLHRAAGSLHISSHAIVLRQHSEGTGLACPLVLDWSPTRRKAATQWRQLTVAEGGVALTGSDACGARWRIGDAQWLYYHALSPRHTARTVLGMHTFNETVIGELDGGELQQLVQVEEGVPE